MRRSLEDSSKRDFHRQELAFGWDSRRYDPGMEIVLVHPEIPHNTGCVARLGAALGLRLNLVEPLGFSLEDRYLKRAGLDYWPMVDLVVHPDWEAAADSLSRAGEMPLAQRLRLFTARGGGSVFETSFNENDILCFGNESQGLPPELLAEYPSRRVYVPIRSDEDVARF